MKFHKQHFMHDPANGFYGDCYRTVIACFLNKPSPESVPHFVELCGKNMEIFDEKVKIYLDQEGWQMIELPITSSKDMTVKDALYATTGFFTKEVYFGFSGTSGNGTNHIVIAQNGKIVHDPARDNSGIVGPCDDGIYWLSLWLPANKL